MIEAIYYDQSWMHKALKYFSMEITMRSPEYDIRLGVWQFANRYSGAELCRATMLEF